MREARPAASRMAHAFTISLLQENAPHPAVSPMTRRRPWPDGPHVRPAPRPYPAAPAAAPDAARGCRNDRSRQQTRNVAGTVPDQRHGLAVERGQHHFARFSPRQRSPVARVHHFQQASRPAMIAVVGGIPRRSRSRSPSGRSDPAVRGSRRAQPLPQVRVKPVRAGKHSAQVRRRGPRKAAQQASNCAGEATRAWGRCSASQWAREASPAGVMSTVYSRGQPLHYDARRAQGSPQQIRHAVGALRPRQKHGQDLARPHKLPHAHTEKSRVRARSRSVKAKRLGAPVVPEVCRLTMRWTSPCDTQQNPASHADGRL